MTDEQGRELLVIEIEHLRAHAKTMAKIQADLIAENERWREQNQTLREERDSSIALALMPFIAEVERLRGYLREYGNHTGDCARRRFEQGRPAACGGYEMKYAGIWYESRPVDRTPQCNCGFSTALAACEEGS